MSEWSIIFNIGSTLRYQIGRQSAFIRCPSVATGTTIGMLLITRRDAR